MQLPYAPTPSSYNVDDSVHLAGVLDQALKKQVRDVSQRSEELENLFVCGLTAVECDILAYLGGFFLRFSKESIGNCEVCKGVLVFRYAWISTYSTSNTSLMEPTHNPT